MPELPMTIREYRPGDCPALAALFRDTVYAVNAADYTEEQRRAWTAGVDLKAWNRSFLSHRTLVAEMGGELAGFADMDGSGILNMLYVHRDFQRRGIASALVNRLEEEARAGGVRRFETYASITAKPFFTRRGYAVLAENTVLRDGVALTNYRMAKELPDETL